MPNHSIEPGCRVSHRDDPEQEGDVVSPIDEFGWLVDWDDIGHENTSAEDLTHLA